MRPDGYDLIYPKFKNYAFGAESVEKFFGISWSSCIVLFYPEDHRNVTAKMVSKKIRKFLKGLDK